MADGAVFEIDRHIDGGLRVGEQCRPLATVRDPYRLAHHDHPALLTLPEKSDATNLTHERFGASIHDRNLGTTEQDASIVDLTGTQGSHQVLDGRHFDAES